MSDEPGFRAETLSTYEPTPDEQIAHLKGRIEELGRERDEALCAEDVAERYREAAEARAARMEEALRKYRDMHDMTAVRNTCECALCKFARRALGGEK